MESRLPKPSAIKRPMTTIKQILPSDRIKAAGSAFHANQTYSAPSVPPLSSNLLNIQPTLARNGGKFSYLTSNWFRQ